MRTSSAFSIMVGVALMVGAMAGAVRAAADEPAAPAATRARVSGDAQSLIDDVSAAYGKLKSLDLAGTISLHVQVEGSRAQDHAAQFTSSFSAPNRFRHQVKDDVLIGSTGQKLYTYRVDQNAYTLGDAPKDRVAFKDLPEQVANLVEMENPSLMLALSKNAAAELVDGVTEASKEDDAKVNDLHCPTLKLAMKDKSTLTLSFDPESHLLRQAKADLTDSLKRRRPDLATAVLTIDYSKVKSADEPAKDELFAWSPPPGASDADAAAAAQPLDAVAASALEGKAAPNFTLESLDGKKVTLADLKGHVVVLDFWATWCGPCRMSLPHLDKLYQAQKEKGVNIFAVDQQEGKGEVEQFVKQTKLSVPVLLDSEGRVGQAYGVEGIPQTVVIDKAGKIKKVFVGFDPDHSPDELKKAVDAAGKD